MGVAEAASTDQQRTPRFMLAARFDDSFEISRVVGVLPNPLRQQSSHPRSQHTLCLGRCKMFCFAERSFSKPDLQSYLPARVRTGLLQPPQHATPGRCQSNPFSVANVEHSTRTRRYLRPVSRTWMQPFLFLRVPASPDLNPYAQTNPTVPTALCLQRLPTATDGRWCGSRSLLSDLVAAQAIFLFLFTNAVGGSLQGDLLTNGSKSQYSVIRLVGVLALSKARLPCRGSDEAPLLQVCRGADFIDMGGGWPIELIGGHLSTLHAPRIALRLWHNSVTSLERATI